MQAIGNGQGLTAPGDVVGVLVHDLSLSDRRAASEAKAQAKAVESAKVRDRQLEAIQDEVVRVLRLNRRPMSLNALAEAVDHHSIGLKARAVRGRIEGCLGSGFEHEGEQVRLHKTGPGEKASILASLCSFANDDLQSVQSGGE